MPKRDNISMSVIRRMPRYYRFLSDLLADDVHRISSRELAHRTGLTASQIRQDLNCFGGFGQQGFGYDVDRLYSEIGRILGVDRGYPAILVGCGNLGRAVAIHLMSSASSAAPAFSLQAAFDRNPMLVGANIHGLPVLDSEAMGDYCAENQIKAAFLCIPTESAPAVVQLLYARGIRSFWNFSHYDIALKYPDAVVENVHLTDSLLTLAYRMTDAEEGKQNTEEQDGES